MRGDSPVRRVHSAEFKAAVLAACQQPGASVAAVALANGVNANLVRKWMIGRGLKRTGLAAPRPRPSSLAADASPMNFVPLALPATPVAAVGAEAERCIRIELRTGAARLAVSWPAGDAATCAAWLRQAVAGLLR